MNNPDHESFGAIGWVLLLTVLDTALIAFIILATSLWM